MRVSVALEKSFKTEAWKSVSHFPLSLRSSFCPSCQSQLSHSSLIKFPFCLGLLYPSEPQLLVIMLINSSQSEAAAFSKDSKTPQPEKRNCCKHYLGHPHLLGSPHSKMWRRPSSLLLGTIFVEVHCRLKVTCLSLNICCCCLACRRFQGSRSFCHLLSCKILSVIQEACSMWTLQF